MITQLLENTKKKSSSKRSKKKRTLTLSESSEEEEKEDALHIEISSKHSEPSDSGEGGFQHISKLEWCLVTVVNQGKLHETGCD